MQAGLLARATEFRDKSSRWVASEADINTLFGGEGEKAPGFAYCWWGAGPDAEKRLREKLQVTVRCLPLAFPQNIPGQPSGASGACAITGQSTGTVAAIAKAY
jgi:hypothetical protein